MDSRQVLDLLNDIERRYPVSEWTARGLRLWPLMRVRTYVLLVHHFLGTGARGAGMRSPLGRVTNAWRSLGRIALNQITDFRGNALPPADATAVFLSDGLSLVEVEGEWYDRFMDPIIAALGESGRSAFLMMPMAGAAVPRHTPSFYVQPLLDAAKAVSTARSRLRPRPSVQLDGFDTMMAELNRAYPEANLPGRSWLLVQADRVSAMARLFERLIGRTGAKAAFVNTYYSAEGMAFVLAARRRGCITVDVQHGNQADHVAYGRWMSAPEEGFELLPDRFWVWGEDEARVINDGPGAHPAHRAVAVGNLWASSWQKVLGPLAVRYKERLLAAAGASGARHHILVTPGFGHSPGEFDPVLEAIAASPSDFCWWLRLHPAHGPDGEALAGRAVAANPLGVQVELPNSMPLPVLLDIMAANVTQASSTVLEARDAGVPSIITTAYGASIFSKEVQNGHALVATTAEGILAAARELSNRNPLSGERRQAGTVPLGAALGELFASADGADPPRRAKPPQPVRPDAETDARCH